MEQLLPLAIFVAKCEVNENTTIDAKTPHKTTLSKGNAKTNRIGSTK